MVFKGTGKLGAGDVEKKIKSYGGILNGSVSRDMTAFNVTVPAERLKDTLILLKDILLNAKIDSGELAKEKEVIAKEIGLGNDEPRSLAFKLLNQTAYTSHTYRYPVIGYENKLRSLAREDVVKYYNRMYVPNRMVLTIAGGVDAASAIETAENVFMDFRQPEYGVSCLSPPEKTQLGARSLTVEKNINLAYLEMGYRSTCLLDEDLFAMDVLAMILGRGNNSRLNTSLLKNKKLAFCVSCWNHTPQDPGLFVISAITAAENLNGAQIAAAEEIRKISEEGVNGEELENARRMVAADYIFSRQTIEEQSEDMASSYALTGSEDFSRRYVKRIQEVSKEDVMRVARKYLKPDNLTVVRIVPRAFETDKIARPAEAGAKPDTGIRKETLANGLRILIREDKKTPTVSVTAVVLAGLMVEDELTNGVSNLTAGTMLRGTKTRPERQIRGVLENMGGDISSFGGFNTAGLNMRILSADVDTALAILKDVLVNPVFLQDEIDKEKTLVLAEIKNEDDDIFRKNLNALRKAVFRGSPYAMRPIGEEKSIGPMTRRALVDFHKKYFVPDNMVISISGDISAKQAMDKLKAAFSGMKSSGIKIQKPDIRVNDRIKSQRLYMEREESLVTLGFRTVDMKSPDRYPLAVLGSVLSGSSGRLFNELRGRLSLAYNLGCAQRLALNAGYMVLYVATTKDRIPDVRRGLFTQIEEVSRKYVGDEELAMAKRELCTDYRIKAQTNDFFSYTSALDELCGLGYDNLYKYDREIEKITKEDVKRVAGKYLDPKTCAEVVVSPEIAGCDI